MSTRAVSPRTGLCCRLASRPTLRWAWPWWCKTSWVLLWSPSTGEQGRESRAWRAGAGAAACSPVVSVHRSLAITLPEPPGGPLDLTPWLHSLTESLLPKLLRQADPQHVIEYSLALITVLNEVSAGGLPSAGGGRPRALLPTGPLHSCEGFVPWLPTDKISDLLEMTPVLSRPLCGFSPAPGFACPHLPPQPISSCTPAPEGGPGEDPLRSRRNSLSHCPHYAALLVGMPVTR